MFVIAVNLVVAVFGAVFGGGSYLAITALGAAWDAAVAGIKGACGNIAEVRRKEDGRRRVPTVKDDPEPKS
jgi:membrane associated rhomboid family serine protease